MNVQKRFGARAEEDQIYRTPGREMVRMKTLLLENFCN